MLRAHPTATAGAAGTFSFASIANASGRSCRNGGDRRGGSRCPPHAERGRRVVEAGRCLRKGGRALAGVLSARWLTPAQLRKRIALGQKITPRAQRSPRERLENLRSEA